MTSIRSSLSRIALLSLTAVACAAVSGAVALISYSMTISTTDLASGHSLFKLLRDPFVRDIWLVLTIGGALVGLLFSLFILRLADLVKAVPWVFGCTVLASAVLPLFLGPVAPLGVLIVSVITMIWTSIEFRSTRSK